jgi:arsenite methyltransferase
VTDSRPTSEILRDAVRARYAAVASEGGSCGSGADSACGCGDGCCATPDRGSPPEALGYSLTEIRMLPPRANLGLGCGNPTALLTLRPGEVVLDLGSGGGIDCFVAARKVGLQGRVIGVDMTPEMVGRARAQAREAGFENVEFRLGEIEHLPVADATVDAVISNCVINLVPDASEVYREAFRVLRPGGRLAVSDMVALQKVPEAVRSDPDRWASCSAGARSPEELTAILRAAGFAHVSITVAATGESTASRDAQSGTGIISGSIRAEKPAVR